MKKYVFVYPGSREQFDEAFERLRAASQNDYLVKSDDGSYRFGVAPGGHSGGYWYCPTCTEEDGKLVFSGKIRYLSLHPPKTKKERFLNRLGWVLLFVFLWIFTLPLVLFFNLFRGIAWIILRLLGKPTERDGMENTLYTLMTDRLGCEKQ